MNIEEDINDKIKIAMKNHDSFGLTVLRSIKSAFELFKKKEKGNVIDEKTSVDVIRGMIKSRKLSAEKYKEAGRKDLEEEELKQIEELEKFLPKEITDGELKEEIIKIMCEEKIYEEAHIGKLLKVAIPKLSSKADKTRIAEMSKNVMKAYENKRYAGVNK